MQEKQLGRKSIDATTTSTTIVRRTYLGEEAKGKNSVAIFILHPDKA